MKYTDLLHDRASLERGQELTELYLESFAAYRRSLHNPVDKPYTYQQGELIELYASELTETELAREDYEKFGRKVIDIAKAYEAQGQLFTEAYAPVRDFLTRFEDNLVAVSSVKQSHFTHPITEGSRRLKRAGGLVAVSIPHVAALGVKQTPGASKPKYEVQVFDGGIKTAVIALSDTRD